MIRLTPLRRRLASTLLAAGIFAGTGAAGIITVSHVGEATAVVQGLQAPNEFEVVKRVAAACPGLINRDHEFTDAVATVLHGLDSRWGRNGKRGNSSDLSHDAVAWKNPGGSPIGVSIVDIIGCAGGGPNCSPSPAWIDQTAETIRLNTTGVHVPPSGRLPACLTGGSNPDPVKPPPVVTPPPGQAPELAAILAIVQRIESRVDRLEARPVPDPVAVDLGMLHEYVDDMIGNGPGDGAPNHITDLKQRIDALSERARRDDALEAWLRSRPVLRF